MRLAFQHQRGALGKEAPPHLFQVAAVELCLHTLALGWGEGYGVRVGSISGVGWEGGIGIRSQRVRVTLGWSQG